MSNLKLNQIPTDQPNAFVCVPTGWNREFDFFEETVKYFTLEITTQDNQGRKDSFREIIFYPKGLGQEIIDEIYCRKIKGREIISVEIIRGKSNNNNCQIDEETGKIILRKAENNYSREPCTEDFSRDFPFAEDSLETTINGFHCTNCGEIYSGIKVPETFLLKTA